MFGSPAARAVLLAETIGVQTVLLFSLAGERLRVPHLLAAALLRLGVFLPGPAGDRSVELLLRLALIPKVFRYIRLVLGNLRFAVGTTFPRTQGLNSSPFLDSFVFSGQSQSSVGASTGELPRERQPRYEMEAQYC